MFLWFLHGINEISKFPKFINSFETLPHYINKKGKYISGNFQKYPIKLFTMISWEQAAYLVIFKLN